MKLTRILAVVIAAALSGTALLAQEEHAKTGGMQGMDEQKHREIMPMHAKMMEEQKKQDAEMDKLLTEMNAASGEKRVDAIVAVLNKLIEQRKIMNEKMAAHLDK
jgi:hypothetical protein